MALTEKLTAIADAIRVQSEKTDKLTLAQMPIEIADLHPLNFKLVGNPQPADPTENTIWVNTDTPITGYIFSATQPTAPVEGMVWIFTGNSSPAEFNALRKNGITVYPLSAKQYISGAWVYKEAKTYMNGTWADWTIHLYNKGNECTDITGGWSAFSCTTDANLYSAGCVKGSDRLTIKTTTSRGSAAFATNNMIDLTKYSYVEFVVPYLKECAIFGVSKYKSTSTWANTVSHANPSVGLSNAVVKVDVTNLSGSYYVWFGDWHTAYAEECQVTEIRLV